MRKFLLNKLVRDNIAADMKRLGQRPAYKKLSDTQYKRALLAKLEEEVGEIKLSDNMDMIKELADVLEVIEALSVQAGVDFKQIRQMQKVRRQERGGFDKRVYIESLTLSDDDSWAQYYASQPDRFKEVK